MENIKEYVDDTITEKCDAYPWVYFIKIQRSFVFTLVIYQCGLTSKFILILITGKCQVDLSYKKLS